ncbi:MAG TPA: AsnC family protein, partial [Thermoplasmataceae archaeon]|nr:AsnC family protein [Thermoplasmataceae archaeon]
KIRCLEETTLYGFQAETLDGLLRKIEEAGRELGDPVMKYIPLQGTISMNVGKLDYQIIEALKHDPRASASDLASQFDVPYLTVKRRLNLLIRNHLIGVITRVDLTSGDIVLFSIFTDKVDRISPLLGQRLVFAIADERSGVYICFSENLRYAKETIRNVRAVDPEAEVMVLYEYEVFA